MFALTFTINQNSTDLVQSHQFYHSTALISILLFISEQASEAEEVLLFLQANESISRFPCLSPFFYPSTISYFSLSLSYCSERENAPCINIQTVASMQRIKILHETRITKSHNGLRRRIVKSQLFAIYN
jgi:hypothetical protein